MQFEVPVRRCAKGHVIPLNGEFVNGKLLETPRIACEQCAIKQGGIVTKRLPKLKNGKRDRLQENFLDKVPSIFVT